MLQVRKKEEQEEEEEEEKAQEGQQEMLRKEGLALGREPLLPIKVPALQKQGISPLWVFMLVIEVFIYSSYSLLVHMDKVDGKIPFSSSSVVLLTELLKLLIALSMYLPEFKAANYRLPPLTYVGFLPFCVPAFLYTVNNNVAVHLQVHMDPTTFQVLSNMKIGATALLYRFIIKRAISVRQWISLGLLLLAAVCDSMGGFTTKVAESPHQIYITFPGIAMMTVHCIISGLAAVVTEFVFKKHLKMSIHFQNSVLYIVGIVMNGIAWLLPINSQSELPDNQGFLQGFTINTWVLVVSQALNGLIMSVVMKHGSNITRLFIITCSMLVNTLLSMVVMGTVINIFFVIAVILAAIALYLYLH